MANLRFIIPALLWVAALHAAAQEEISRDSYRRRIGALTTTFTPDESCFEEIRTTAVYDYPYLYIGCQGPAGNECCPSNWASNRFYSPGVCPKGYQACTLATTVQRDETTNLCCPSGFDCPTNVNAMCRSLINTAHTIIQEASTGIETFSRDGVTATPIQIRFKASDSDVIPIPTESFNLPSEGSNLSTGAKAGIGVGVTLAVVAIALACWRLVRRRRARRGAGTPAQDVALLHVQAQPESVSDITFHHVQAEPEPTEAPPPYEKNVRVGAAL